MRFIVSGYYGPYPSIVDSVADGLRRHGHKIRIHEIYSPTLTIGRDEKRKKFFPRLPGHLHHSHKFLENLIETFRPDVLFVLRGDELDSEKLSYLRDQYGFDIWHWIYDPLEKASAALNLAKNANRVFHFSAYESLQLKQFFPDKDVLFLPGAYDDRYHTFPHTDKNYSVSQDIFFCGALGTPLYDYRLKFLEKISGKASNLSTKVYYKPSTFNALKNYRFRKMVRRNYPDLYTNLDLRSLSRRQLVNEYHQSTACLNLHDLNANGVGLSWRTFEILGSGGMMITDRHPELSACFGDNIPFEVFDTADDAINFTLELKNNPNLVNVMRQTARLHAPEHTYYHRLKGILPRQEVGD